MLFEDDREESERDDNKIMNSARRQRQCGYGYLLTALIQVFDQVTEPGSDKWVNHSLYRRQVMEAVLDKWTDRTGLDRDMFPWTEDFVCGLWVEFRKLDKPLKPKLRQALARDPGNWE